MMSIAIPTMQFGNCLILCTTMNSVLLVITVLLSSTVHVSSFSYQQQANFYLSPTEYDDSHDSYCFSPHPPPYPPLDFEKERLMLEHKNSSNRSIQPLPMTNNPYALLDLDWLNPPSEFDIIHKAYRKMAKRYHPDLTQNNSLTQEEQREANNNFSRINAAYEHLKAKQYEEILDYTIYIDGRKERRYVTIKSKSYYTDPTRPDYDRIIAMTKYREKYPKKKLWFERKHDYEPRHNGEWKP